MGHGVLFGPNHDRAAHSTEPGADMWVPSGRPLSSLASVARGP
jgi:hypothetical protein